MARWIPSGSRRTLSAMSAMTREMEPEQVTLGQLLKHARKAKSLSQRGAAKALGISESSYLRWELDRSQPVVSKIRSISEFLEMEIRDLLPIWEQGGKRARS
jgi:transcriptional regulator with XRE-family HTH domain